MMVKWTAGRSITCIAHKAPSSPQIVGHSGKSPSLPKRLQGVCDTHIIPC